MANLHKAAMEKLNLSARAYDTILKVSRTIADLSASTGIKPQTYGGSHTIPQFGQGRLGGMRKVVSPYSIVLIRSRLKTNDY